MDTPCRTFSYRAAAIGVAAMIAMGLWIHFHEVLVPQPNILAENSPPASAVGVFVGVMLIGAIVARLRRTLRLAVGELIVVYAMLAVSAPLMSQGMWHRFLGLIIAIPENPENLPLVDSYSEKLWPHGEHLIADRRFASAFPVPRSACPTVRTEDTAGQASRGTPGNGSVPRSASPTVPGLGASQGTRLDKPAVAQGSTHEGQGTFCAAEPPERVTGVDVEESAVGRTSGVQLSNPRAPEAGDRLAETVLRIRVPRFRGGREILVPGERYYATALFCLSGFETRSSLTVELVTDGGERAAIATLRRDTTHAYSRPGSFQRVGQPYVTLPRDLREHADLVFTLRGQGTAVITDVVFFSNEALARLRKGVTEIRESDLARLPANDRDSLVVRPDRLASGSGVAYALRGYIPYRQWLQPLLYWLALVMAMFLGLLGLGVIFRKQWAENERFSFPMIVLPRLLIEEADPPSRGFDTRGRVESAPDSIPSRGREARGRERVWRKTTFKVGIAVAFAYCLLQGLSHYVPGMPDPSVRVDLAEYFSSLEMKALVNGMGGGQFTIVLLFASIAFFIDLDMLLSILVFFWLAKVPYYFGEAFGWKTLKGPLDDFPFPHEQHIGAFLSLVLVVLWTARKHLAAVARRVLGRPGGADDSQEAMSYRTAVLLAVGSLVFFALWGSMTGVGWGSALVFFGFLVICGVSAARIRTECGAPFTYFTPYFPYLIFFLAGGLFTFGTPTFVLAYAAGGFMAVAQFLLFAPTQVEMLHLAGMQKASPRGVKWALIVGALGGVLIGGYVMMVWAYGKGGDNIRYMKSWAIGQDWYFRTLRVEVAAADTEVLAADAARARGEGEAPAEPSGPGEGSGSAGASPSQDAAGKKPAPHYPTGPLVGVGVGSAVTLGLAFLRTHFVGFWLHPIGYILANSYFAYAVWGSVLAAWVVKWLGLKIGGPRLIREQMTPFFGGIFLGCVLGMAFWDIAGLVAMARGASDVFTCFP